MKTTLIITGSLLISLLIYKLTNKTKQRAMTIKSNEALEKKGVKVLTLKKYLKTYNFKGKYRKVPSIQ